MPTAPTNTLYNRESTERPNEVSTGLLSRNVIRSEDCPWVEIGNLYVSVTITGDKSWLPLISLLQAKHKKFAVITGRHGDIPNIYDSKTRESLHIFDAEHVVQDTSVKNSATTEFKDITVDLIDAGQQRVNQKSWLIGETSRLIQADYKVIYAWCYSLFSMCELPQSIAENQDLHSILQMAVISRPISDLVRQFYRWVP